MTTTTDPQAPTDTAAAWSAAALVPASRRIVVRRDGRIFNGEPVCFCDVGNGRAHYPSRVCY